MAKKKSQKKVKRKVTTPEFRVSYPAVFKPRFNEESGKEEYKVQALFRKGEDLSKMKAVATKALQDKFGNKLKSKSFVKNIKSPFKDQGDCIKTDENGEEFLPDGYVEGAKYCEFKSYQKPGVVDKAVEDIVDSSQFYGGCFASATVVAVAYEVKGNKGVSFWLQNLQKTKEGDPFGTRSKPSDDFKPIEVDEEEEVDSADDLW
jgi:hypothetical protein